MFICWASSSGNAVVILHERNFTEIHAQLRAFLHVPGIRRSLVQTGFGISERLSVQSADGEI